MPKFVQEPKKVRIRLMNIAMPVFKETIIGCHLQTIYQPTNTLLKTTIQRGIFNHHRERR